MSRRALGEGLGALIPTGEVDLREESMDLREVPGVQLLDLPVAQIEANPSQPRQNFAPEALAELVHSLKTVGLLQPVVGRSAGAGYELVAGERRWRAAEEAGWQSVPVLVR